MQMDQETWPHLITDNVQHCGSHAACRVHFFAHMTLPFLRTRCRGALWMTTYSQCDCVVTDWETGGERGVEGMRQWDVVHRLSQLKATGAKAQEHQVLKVWITNTGSRLRRIIPGTLCLFQLMTLSSVDTSRTHLTCAHGYTHTPTCTAEWRLLLPGSPGS